MATNIKNTINANNVLYIIMRTDLPSMNPGKAMAQASHASNAFIHKYGNMEGFVKDWQKQTPQGFGTVIVLGATQAQLIEIESVELVYDPTYPYSVSAEIFPLINPETITAIPINKPDGSYILCRSEITCGYVFGTRENLKDIIGHLPLHP
jgi:peptidyl-tRNA hydrolase